MNILKEIIPYKYKRKIKENLGVPSLHWSLLNLKRKGFNPSVIIDVGAYEGFWTIDVLEVFPSAKILMVEAQKKKEAILQKVVKNHSNTDYTIALLSATEADEKLFSESETSSHVVVNERNGDTVYKLRTQTLDNLLEQKKIQLPDFLKLDVQGHELEVLKGAEKSLAHSEICLLEISLLELGDNTPLLAEMVSFMDKKNFQAYDISQFMRRPFDKALYQIDMFFVKKDSPLVASKRWA